MPTVAEVVRRYGGAYLERFGAAMPAAHKKVLGRDRRLPHRRAGTGALPVRVLRPDAGHGPLLRRPALPGLPARQGRGLAREPDRPPAAVSLLPGHLHAAGRAARRRAEPSAGGLLRAVRGLQRGDQGAGRRPEVRRHRSGAASSASCTPGAGRWSITRTSITSSRAEASATTAPAGCRRAPISSCRSQALSILFRARFRDAPPARRPARPGRPGGMAAGLGRALAGRRRRPAVASAISPRTSFASPSATTGSSRATTAG